MDATSATPLPLNSPKRSGLPRMQEAGLLVVVLGLGLVLGIFGRPIFLRPDNLIGGVLTPMATYAIMAVGVTFVIIAGGIDISVGSIFALSALCTAKVLQNFPEDAGALKTIPAALAIACGVGLACGILNGLLVVLLRVHPFIVTLGTMGVFRCACNTWVTSPMIKTLPAPGNTLPMSFTDNFMMAELPKDWLKLSGIQPMPIIVALGCVIAGGFYLSLMVAGRENYAIGGNEEAARFSGLAVWRIKLRVYALCGLAAGIAGWVSVGYFGSASSATGQGYELSVIAAAVVGGASLTGGRGTALGALLGALVIKLIENGILVLHWNRDYSGGIIGSSIIIAVAVDQLSEHLRNKRLTSRSGT